MWGTWLGRGGSFLSLTVDEDTQLPIDAYLPAAAEGGMGAVARHGTPPLPPSS